MHKATWLVLIPVFGIFYGVKSIENKAKAEKEKQIAEHFNVPPGKGKIRGWDFNNNGWRKEEVVEQTHRTSRTYTDRELQELREYLEYDTEGRYFHIPGKRILTREMEMEEAIEMYIEDNLDEIMDQYYR